jgi:23S rRNA (cytosine1962-C5)-methyltransferase
MKLPTLRLNPKADYRLRNGHLWIYSNEIDNKYSPLIACPSGSSAIIENAQGHFMGIAHINPNNLICGRIINTINPSPLDIEILQQRIKKSLEIREQIFTSRCYRLIYGESDFLPGLIVDRFYDTLVVQIASVGMESCKDLIIEALDYCIRPNNILLKNDHKMREIEGLPSYVTWVKGAAADNILLEENGIKFQAPVTNGQKTGWFYDHRMTRARLKDYVKGKRVLDMFSYIGGWGIQAAAFGAQQVICSDISEFALTHVIQNAKLNKLNNVSTLLGDAFDVMHTLQQDQQQFDVVILDPPAFIPRRKDLPKGIAAYQKANLQALRLLKPGGILVTGSCSMHLPAADFVNAIYKAARKSGGNLQILEQGNQGPDHPIHPAIPETSYLKSLICRYIAQELPLLTGSSKLN